MTVKSKTLLMRRTLTVQRFACIMLNTLKNILTQDNDMRRVRTANAKSLDLPPLLRMLASTIENASWKMKNNTE